MKKLIIAFLLFPMLSISQVQDVDIVNTLMGANVFDIEAPLDSLGLWYHPNPRPTFNTNSVLSISIENGNEITKLFLLDHHRSGEIFEIIINYQHDSKAQFEELDKMLWINDYVHVGKFSTDVKITKKKWKKLNKE